MEVEGRKRKRGKGKKWRGKEVVESCIWKELPENLLLEDVVARLPIAALFRARLVCRKWNSLLESPCFLQRRKEVSLPNKPWVYSSVFVHQKVETLAMYDPCINRWHPNWTGPSSLYPLASTGGLVCCLDPSKSCFVVANPMMRTRVREFSPSALLELRGIAVGMVSTSGEGYKIVYLNSLGQYEVYDSFKAGSIKGTISAYLTLNYTPPPVTIGTVVYLLIWNPDGILLSYDSESGAWEVLPIPAPPESRMVFLAQSGGRILLTGLVRGSGGALTVCVWELKRAALAWTELDRMPESWCSGVSFGEAYFECVGNNRLLMMALIKSGVNQIFTYDSATREWSKAPRVALPGSRCRPYTRCGVAFFPSLSDAP